MSEITYIAEKLNKKWISGFKQLGNNPKALTKNIYINTVLPNIDKYYITDKADGLRAFLLIKPTSIKYLTSEDINFIQIENTFQNEYIFDCELIDGILYIFDVIIYDGENVASNTFEQRYKKLQEFQKVIENKKLKEYVTVKTFYKLGFKTYQQQIMDLYKYKAKKLPYKIDGIIFIESGKNYNDTINLKWKPAEMLTIDFLALQDKEKKYGYILTNGIKASMAKQFNIEPDKKFAELLETLVNEQQIEIKEDYIPVPFYNSLRPNIYFYESNIKEDLHGHIIELSFDSKTGKWDFHRIRHDRDVELKKGSYYGNNYKVAETTLQSILNPLSLKELMLPFGTLTKDSYFKKQDESYKSVKRFNNYVKNLLIQQHKNSEFVLDLASGRGDDLQKYVNANVKNLLMLEVDIDAIDELLDRKYNILTKSSGNCNLVVLQADLNDDHKKTIQFVSDNFTNANAFMNNKFEPSLGSPIIFCHFAMHYLLKSEKSAKNIVFLIAHYLSKGGSFIMTIFDGSKVFDLLKQHKGKWAPNKKYMISFIGGQPNIFAGFGHKINVLLPLADKPYEEPLIDLYALDKIFKPHGIQRSSERSFGDMLSEYKKNNSNQIFDKDDDQFVSLYKYVVYSVL